jgi:hypothetical protein
MPVISDLSAATAALGRYTAVLGQDRLNLAGGSFYLDPPLLFDIGL